MPFPQSGNGGAFHRQPPSRRRASTSPGLRLSARPGLRLSARPGLRPGEHRLCPRPAGWAFPGVRRRPARPQPAADRGVRHLQPPPDLRVTGALRPPRPGLLPLRRGHLPRRARAVMPDQRRRPVPLRRVPQRRDVVLRQPQHRRDHPAPEPQLPQRRQRDVPHHDWGAPSLPDCGPPVGSIRKGLGVNGRQEKEFHA